MQIKSSALLVMCLSTVACLSPKSDKPLPRLSIYSGNVQGVYRPGYLHAVQSVINEMSNHMEFFSGTEVVVTRFGDRHSLQAPPVLVVKLPIWPPCPQKFFKTGESERNRECREKQERAAADFQQTFLLIKEALDSKPVSLECVSYKNLMHRLVYGESLSPSIIISDGSHACTDSDLDLEPLPNAKRSIFLIHLAPESGYLETREFLTRILQPQAVILGSTAEQAVKALVQSFKGSVAPTVDS